MAKLNYLEQKRWATELRSIRKLSPQNHFKPVWLKCKDVFSLELRRPKCNAMLVRAFAECRYPTGNTPSILRVGLAKPLFHIALLNWPDNRVPHDGPQQRVNQYWYRLENYRDGDALSNSGNGHRITHVVIGTRYDQMVGLV